MQVLTGCKNGFLVACVAGDSFLIAPPLRFCYHNPMRDLTRTDTGRLANRASGDPVGQLTGVVSDGGDTTPICPITWTR